MLVKLTKPVKRNYLLQSVAFFLALVICCPVFSDDAPPADATAPKKVLEKKVKAVVRKPASEEKKSFDAKMEQVRPEADYGDTRFYRYKTNFLVGVSILSGSSLLMGGQLGYAPFEGTPLYIGPEVNFSLFSPGSVLNFLAGGWYEFRVYGAPRLSINLGAVAGPAFANNVSGLNSFNLGAYLDACIVQEVNDLVSVRGQFRPGVVAGLFAFMMNFNVSFRFL